MGQAGEFDRSNCINIEGNVLFGADDRVAQWVAKRVPSLVPSKNVRALGVIKDKRVVAGVAFDDYNGPHIWASIAAIKGVSWANRSTLFHLFYYPFVTLGCQAISVAVPSTNLESLNLASKMGFTPEAILRFAAHDGSSAVILKMFKSDCKWITDHGKKGRLQGPEGTRP